MTNSEDAATYLAHIIAPDEIDLAPDMLAAVVSGASTDRGVSEEPILGAFGAAEVVSVLSATFGAIGDLAPAITTYIVAGSGSITIGKAVSDWWGSRKASAAKGEKARPPEGTEEFVELAEKLEARLIARGMGEEQAGNIAFKSLMALVEAPDHAKTLTDELAKSKP